MTILTSMDIAPGETMVFQQASRGKRVRICFQDDTEIVIDLAPGQKFELQRGRQMNPEIVLEALDMDPGDLREVA